MPSCSSAIAYGPLLSDDGATWLGTAALIQAPDSMTARSLLTSKEYDVVEVPPWRFRGRPS